MARTERSKQIEEHEDLAAQLSAARSAQTRQLLKLRTATDLRILRLARLVRTPELLTEVEELADVLLDMWDDVALQAWALESAHEYIKRQRRND